MSAPKLQPTDYGDFELLVKRVASLENAARQSPTALDIASVPVEPAPPTGTNTVRLYVFNGTLKAVKSSGARTTVF